jgi:hypothetical protein
LTVKACGIRKVIEGKCGQKRVGTVGPDELFARKERCRGNVATAGRRTRETEKPSTAQNCRQRVAAVRRHLSLSLPVKDGKQ